MTKILITGATGFLGKHVVQLFRSRPYTVYEASRKQGVDLLSYQSFLDYLKKIKVEILIHCAAHVGGIAYNRLHPVEIFEENTLIGLNVVKGCYEAGIKTFINVMPNCTYPGNLDEYEESKWWDGLLHETVLTYGLPRKMLWGTCFAYCQKDPLFKPVHLILPNMYGSGDHFDIIRSHALGALIVKIVDAKRTAKKEVEVWGTGNPIREWLYVEDGALAILKTFEHINQFVPNEIMNVGIKKGISIRELADRIKNIVGWEGKFIYRPDMPDGAMKKILVSEKMKNKLKWMPTISLEEGISKTVKWYMENS